MCSFSTNVGWIFKETIGVGECQKNARKCQKHYFSSVVHMIHALKKSQKMPECIFDMFLCVVNESWKKARKCQMSQNSRNICSCVIGNTSWWWCVDWTEWGLKKMPENARCSFLTNYGGWYTSKKKPENARRHFSHINMVVGSTLNTMIQLCAHICHAYESHTKKARKCQMCFFTFCINRLSHHPVVYALHCDSWH